MTTQEDGTHIVLFDGVCVLCSNFVKFIIDRDHAKRFHFASIQSDAGRRALRDCGFHTDELNTVVYIESQKYSLKSTAVLNICRDLGGIWKLLYIKFIFIPRFIRDSVYDFIAGRRYRWFGEFDSCRAPSPDLKDRFLK